MNRTATKKRCKCGATGTAAELRAAGHPKGCAAQTEAKPTSSTTSATTPAKPSPNGTVDLGAQCKAMRDDQGLSWMAIGARLGLPGSKNGAANARKLYAEANGAPHAAKSRAAAPARKKVEKPPAARGTKTDRKLAVAAGTHVIPNDMPDEEVIAMLRGRTIEWGINLGRLWPGSDHWVNQEARVHPEDVVMEEEPDLEGNRVVRFREYVGLDERGRHMSGPTRTVRVSAIHTVR